MNEPEEKIFFGITKVTGSLRSKHRYRKKDLYAHEQTDQSGEDELEERQTPGLVYDFRGIYPTKRSDPSKRKSTSEKTDRNDRR
jgi:hypothetical protein